MDLTLEEINEELKSLTALKAKLTSQITEFKAGITGGAVFVSFDNLNLVSAANIFSQNIKVTLDEYWCYGSINTFQIKRPF